MNDPTIDELDRALEEMAAFDRQEAEVDSIPEHWSAVSRGELEAEEASELAALYAPMEEERAQEILDEVLAAHDPTPAEVIPIRSRSWGSKWVPTIIAAGLVAAAGLLLWLGRGGSPGVDEGADGSAIIAKIVPRRIELGGTARVLGDDGEAPRPYGPGDAFLLRAVPLGIDDSEAQADLYATPQGGGVRQRLDLVRSKADDGAIEFRGEIARSLSPGFWTLRTEIGPVGGCTRETVGCSEVDVRIEIVE